MILIKLNISSQEATVASFWNANLIILLKNTIV